MPTFWDATYGLYVDHKIVARVQKLSQHLSINHNSDGVGFLVGYVVSGI